MEYIVDIQGSWNDMKEFIIMEIAILALEPDAQPTVLFFDPPCDLKLLPSRYKSNNFLDSLFYKKNIPYNELVGTLKSN